MVIVWRLVFPLNLKSKTITGTSWVGYHYPKPNPTWPTSGILKNSKNLFHHIMGRGYNKNCVLYSRPLRWWNYFLLFYMCHLMMGLTRY